MAVAHDAISESHTGTTGSASEASFGWTHTLAAGAKGLVVAVANFSANADTSSAVDVGGTPLAAVTGGGIGCGGSEPGYIKAWFLGSGLPTGAQTITVTRTNNTDIMWAAGWSVTALTNTEYTGVATLSSGAGTTSQTEVNVDDGSPGTNSLRYAAMYSGLVSVPSPGANSSGANSIDVGGNCAVCVRETVAGQGARPVGWSAAADELARVVLAIREVAGGAADKGPLIGGRLVNRSRLLGRLAA